jgi:GNAT superfamily N-acetyltransferase
MHPIIKNLKRVSRLVVLPDYQGIGIGTSFLETIARHIVEHGFEFDITTSAKNLIMALNRRNQWKLKRVGRMSPNTDPSIRQRSNVKTATFFFRHIKK